jgi:hypothetical protein
MRGPSQIIMLNAVVLGLVAVTLQQASSSGGGPDAMLTLRVEQSDVGDCSDEALCVGGFFNYDCDPYIIVWINGRLMNQSNPGVQWDTEMPMWSWTLPSVCSDGNAIVQFEVWDRDDVFGCDEDDLLMRENFSISAFDASGLPTGFETVRNQDGYSTTFSYTWARSCTTQQAGLCSGTDRMVCQACDTSTQWLDTSDFACAPLTVCPTSPDVMEYVAPTPTSDRVCGLVPFGYWSPMDGSMTGPPGVSDFTITVTTGVRTENEQTSSRNWAADMSRISESRFNVGATVGATAGAIAGSVSAGYTSGTTNTESVSSVLTESFRRYIETEDVTTRQWTFRSGPYTHWQFFIRYVGFGPTTNTTRVVETYSFTSTPNINYLPCCLPGYMLPGALPEDAPCEPIRASVDPFEVIGPGPILCRTESPTFTFALPTTAAPVGGGVSDTSSTGGDGGGGGDAITVGVVIAVAAAVIVVVIVTVLLRRQQRNKENVIVTVLDSPGRAAAHTTDNPAFSTSTARLDGGGCGAASAPDHSTQNCAYVSSTGRACLLGATNGGRWCLNHACGCGKSKSSKEPACDSCQAPESPYGDRFGFDA